MAATASAQGIGTGLGDSSLSNSGDIQASATAASSGIASSDSIDDAWSQVDTVLAAEAQGISAAGGGTVTVENSGSIEVDATATGYAYGRGDSGGDGYGEVYLTMDPTVSASGIQVGDAVRTEIRNQAGSTIDVDATVSVNLDANGDEYAVVGRDWNHGVEAATAASGIAAGSGEVVIVNEGTVDVTLDSKVDVWTYSHSGNRSTHTYAWMTSNATAVGIEAGSGAHFVDNTGTVTVGAVNTVDGNRGNPESDSYYNADAQVGAFAYTIARGTAVGDGDAELGNSGSVDVSAVSHAYGYTRADSGAGDGNALTAAGTTPLLRVCTQEAGAAK